MAALGRAEKGAGSDELRVMVAGQAGQNAATDLVGGAAVGGLLKLLGKVYKKLRGVPGVSQAVRDQVENLGPEAVEKLSKKLDDLADAGNLNQATVKEAVDEVVEAVAPIRAADPKAVVNALSSWNSRKFFVDGQNLLLDKSGLKHILERHHPSFWNGTPKVAVHSLPK